MKREGGTFRSIPRRSRTCHPPRDREAFLQHPVDRPQFQACHGQGHPNLRYCPREEEVDMDWRGGHRHFHHQHQGFPSHPFNRGGYPPPSTYDDIGYGYNSYSGTRPGRESSQWLRQMMDPGGRFESRPPPPPTQYHSYGRTPSPRTPYYHPPGSPPPRHPSDRVSYSNRPHLYPSSYVGEHPRFYQHPRRGCGGYNGYGGGGGGCGGGGGGGGGDEGHTCDVGTHHDMPGGDGNAPGCPHNHLHAHQQHDHDHDHDEDGPRCHGHGQGYHAGHHSNLTDHPGRKMTCPCPGGPREGPRNPWTTSKTTEALNRAAPCAGPPCRVSRSQHCHGTGEGGRRSRSSWQDRGATDRAYASDTACRRRHRGQAPSSNHFPPLHSHYPPQPHTTHPGWHRYGPSSGGACRDLSYSSRPQNHYDPCGGRGDLYPAAHRDSYGVGYPEHCAGGRGGGRRSRTRARSPRPKARKKSQQTAERKKPPMRFL